MHRRRTPTALAVDRCHRSRHDTSHLYWPAPGTGPPWLLASRQPPVRVRPAHHPGRRHRRRSEPLSMRSRKFHGQGRSGEAAPRVLPSWMPMPSGSWLLVLSASKSLWCRIGKRFLLRWLWLPGSHRRHGPSLWYQRELSIGVRVERPA